MRVLKTLGEISRIVNYPGPLNIPLPRAGELVCRGIETGRRGWRGSRWEHWSRDADMYFPGSAVMFEHEERRRLMS